MKAYITLFTLILSLIIISITAISMGSLFRYSIHKSGLDAREIEAINSKLALLYNTTQAKETHKAITEISSDLDRIKSGLVREEVFNRPLAFRLLINILAVTLVCLLLGIALWVSLYRLILAPLTRTVKELKSYSGGAPQFTARGIKEIRYLQTALGELLNRLHDYQEKEKAEERKNMGKYIVHQIKNSLTPIQLCAHNIKNLFPGSLPAGENIDLILKEVESTRKLVEQFRTLYQFPEPYKTDFDLNAFAEAVCRKYGITCFTSCTGKAPVWGDRNLLEQAAGNLIANSLDAADNNPDAVRVTVIDSSGNGLLEGPPRFSLVIEDTGCGMTPEELEKVFDEYYTTKQKGMGIGMAFVKKVLDNHQFPVIIESEKNRGTKVRIDFYGTE